MSIKFTKEQVARYIFLRSKSLFLYGSCQRDSTQLDRTTDTAG